MRPLALFVLLSFLPGCLGTTDDCAAAEAVSTDAGSADAEACTFGATDHETVCTRGSSSPRQAYLEAFCAAASTDCLAGDAGADAECATLDGS